MPTTNFHPLTALVKNESGVLSKISGLFARRGFNIDSLAVGETDDHRYSRMSIVVKGNRDELDQVIKQLDKLIDVIEVKDLSRTPHVERELLLIKVRAGKDDRSEIVELADIFRAKVIDVGREFLTLEVTGNSEKTNALQQMLKEFGIEQLSRTGQVVLERDSKTTDEDNQENQKEER